jgi:transposase InsO family protein
MRYSLNELYSVVGISKQAVAQQLKRNKRRADATIHLLNQVDYERDLCGGLGLRTLYKMIQPDWIGRDRFEQYLTEAGYSVKKVKAYHRTTRPGGAVFPNLIEGMVLTDRWQVWQSDTTYYRIKDTYYYITTIIDIYDRFIEGYAVHDTLRTEANLQALHRALSRSKKPKHIIKIHHSDRGSQYGSIAYRKLLRHHQFSISMGMSGQDNAYVERLHDTLKNQYLRHWSPASFKELKQYTRRAIHHYNNHRPHRSLNMQTPQAYRSLHPSQRENDIHIVHSASKDLDKKSPLKDESKEYHGPFCSLTFVQNGQH